MKIGNLYIILLIPIISLSQPNPCGERPLKPQKAETQSAKDFRNSEVLKKYKLDLKKWKECVSPLAISQRDEERISLEQKKREEKEKAKKLEALNNCGEKPSKPKRPKGLSVDDFRKTKEHGEYRKQLKEWKKCMSPPQLTEPVFSKKKISKANNCGEKPTKPYRSKGTNNQEYRDSQAYKDYRELFKVWKNCEDNFEKSLLWGDCGEKPPKPFRADGTNNQVFRESKEFQAYKESVKDWKECLESQKQK
tara:strand:+ start:1610 stop:2359 length:750 start_codon:yes stop_codon:yes gene_type:complete